MTFERKLNARRNLNEAGSDISLDVFVRKINADNIRRLSDNARHRLQSLFVQIGIAPHKVVLLHMLTDDLSPDILSVKKLEELIGEIKHQIIKVTTQTEPESKPETSPYKRIIKPDETISRFANMGINIPYVIGNWQQFYENSRFGKKVKRLYGAEAYSNPFPMMTDGAMRTFEKALQQRQIDTIILDDHRIPDGMTMKALDRNALKEFMRKYAIDSLEQAKTFIDSTTTSTPTLRFTGFSTKENIAEQNEPICSFYDQVPNLPFHTAMGLGTYIRLKHFLSDNDYGTYVILTSFRYKDSRMMMGRTTQLNNRTRENQILNIGPNPDDKTIKDELDVGPNINNAWTSTGCGPIIIITSDESETMPLRTGWKIPPGIH